jgi:hypothetical protein
VNPRTMPPLLLAAALLAACSGGGGGGATISPQVQSGSPASGTLTIAGPGSGASSLARQPEYISSATAHAALFIDAVTTAAGSSSSCTTGCTIPFTTMSGTHTLSAEIDNGSHVVLAEGTTGPQTIVAGPGNNFTITLNGAAAQFSWVANTGSAPASPAQPTSITANWAVADASGVDITNAPVAATFDGGTITFAVSIVSGLTGSSPTFTPTTLTHPDANGGDYSFTASCNGATGTGTFNVTATSGAGSGDVGAAQLAALAPAVTYPSSTLTVTPHTYTCTNGVISDSSGSGTLQ